MTAGFLVPLDYESSWFRGERGAAWVYVKRRLIEDHPYPLLTGTVPVGDWCKADAVELALDLADDLDVLIVHDADVIVGVPELRKAVSAVESGAVDWAIPHGNVARLTRHSTEELLRDGIISNYRVEPPAYPGVEGGGIVVLRRDLYERCPLDPRFVGWGSEDEAWGYALGVLGGSKWRGSGVLTHLWHPPANPNARRSTNPQSVRLWRAYRSSRHDHDPRRMLALVAGGKARVPLDTRPRTMPR